jgi:cystathionine beta-lyase
MSADDRKPLSPVTRLGHAGRDETSAFRFVNPAVHRGSTVLNASVADLDKNLWDRFGTMTYGRWGGPTHFALQDVMAELENGHRSVIVPSGKAAAAATLLAFVEAGDHVLMVDSVYQPSRSICMALLARFNVETTFYDPLIGAGIAGLIRPNTKLVYTESPGSLSFEVQDIPAIVKAAHAKGVKVAMDNTWATPLYFKPLDFGVDVSVQAATKYIIGHSDAMMGILTMTEEAYKPVTNAIEDMGFSVSPDDCYLALRGLRTLDVRLRRHHETGLAIAQCLERRPEVARVMHPALGSDPGHALWKRDFTGASGLFGVVLQPVADAAVIEMLEGLELFGLGYSWGGYESLAIPTRPGNARSATRWHDEGPCLRLHAGLEDADDLIRDLDAGFARLNRTR